VSASISEQDILQALSQVVDPDLNRDIVSLGFVKNLQIDGDQVRFDVELTTPACPVKDQLRQECEERVAALEGVGHVAVNMTANVRARHAPGRTPVPGVKNVIAVASGKGGVGKSTVSANVAVCLERQGAKVGLADCDIYGPSIPLMFGVHKRPKITPEQKLVPLKKHGLKLMSMGFMVDPDKAVIWRGPMLHKMIQQFLYQVEWEELDYLILDLPPGTGDVQLTITQAIPLAGAVIVTTPQKVSLIDARKGLEMFRSVEVPVLGIIENMSYYPCRKCGKRHEVFSHAGGRRFSEEYKVPFLGEVPIDPAITIGGDEGVPVAAKNSSEAAKAFSEIAGNVAAQVSIASLSSPPSSPLMSISGLGKE